MASGVKTALGSRPVEDDSFSLSDFNFWSRSVMLINHISSGLKEQA